MIRYRFLIIIFVYLLPFYGCGALSYHQKSVDSCIKLIAEKRKNYEVQYVGKPKEILLGDFGKPSIRYDIFKIGVNYEEEWSYTTSGGWLGTACAGAVWFYVNDDKIMAVDVW